MNISFRRLRDTAAVTRNSECIAILAQELVAAVRIQPSTTDLAMRIDAVYRQLEAEYAVRGVRSMVGKLFKPGRALPWFHEVNMAKHQ